MTKKLEEEFNLPPIEEALAKENDETPSIEDTKAEIVKVEDAISVSEKINMAFKEVKGLEEHEGEMNDIAKEAIDSYKKLMSLGMNVSDMAAGKVFAEASNMLKIALDASDSKVKGKLQQVDLMIKKARLDNNTGRSGDTNADGNIVYDRNELLKIMNKNDK
tara:strand:- start:4036 stop:4521 length:486 start_codon:yes stop_codon:yes gene_type:complete